MKEIEAAINFLIQYRTEIIAGSSAFLALAGISHAFLTPHLDTDWEIRGGDFINSFFTGFGK